MCWFISIKRGFDSSGTGLPSAPLPEPWLSLCPTPRGSCLHHRTAPGPPQDTARPGEKIAWDYITKDRLVMCMHKRAKLRSCRQLCNDFWLLNFSSAPILLPIKRPYSPSQPPLFCFLSFLFLTHPCPFTESCFCLCFCLLPLFWYFLYIWLSVSAPISRCCLNKQFTA